MLYPLKFRPIYKQRIWGGNRLASLFNKKSAPANCGESWEISGLPENISVVTNGYLKGNNLQELIEVYMGDLVGEKVFDTFGLDFPLLIKLIDATEDLSFQVHPGDDYAAENLESYGKSELWYVLHAAEGAKLVSGFNRTITRETLLEKIGNHSLPEVACYENAQYGDVFYIPAGRMHSLGKNIVLAEIQQASDITYRIWDFDRFDANGKKRELHIEQALDVLDFSKTVDPRTLYSKLPDKGSSIITTPHFSCNIVCLFNNLERSYVDKDSFVVIICVLGEVNLHYNNEKYNLKKGETILIPAEISDITYEPDGYTEFLEIFVLME